MDKEKKLDVRIIAIVLVAAVIIIVILLVLAVKLYDRKTGDGNNSVPVEEFNEDLLKSQSKKLVEDAIELNKYVSEKYYNTGESSTQNDGSSCYAYNGDDTEDIVKSLKNIYYNEAEGLSLFKIVKSDRKNTPYKLYICPPPSYCELASSLDNFKYEKNEDVATIILGDASYAVVNENDKLKLTSELYTCDINKLREELDKNKDNDNKNIISKEEIDKEKEELSKKKEEASQKNEETPEESQSEEE